MIFNPISTEDIKSPAGPMSPVPRLTSCTPTKFNLYNYLATVVTEPALSILPIFHMPILVLPFLKSLKRIWLILRSCVTFRSKLAFHVEEFSHTFNPQAADSPPFLGGGLLTSIFLTTAIQISYIRIRG
jgi:hypothetical protein